MTPSLHVSSHRSSRPPLKPAQVRVLIVDDERKVFEVAARLLRDAGYGVCEQVDKGEGAADAVARLQPDLVLMDIELNGTVDGIDAAAQLRQNDFEGPLIYFTGHASEGYLQRAHATRPEAFLLKPVAPQQLLAAVELAVARYHEDRRMRQDLRRAREALARVWEVTSAQLGGGQEEEAEEEVRAKTLLRRQLDRLSSREREVFEHAVRGVPLDQLSRELFISPHTARNHLAAIYRKLRVNSRLELTTTYLGIAKDAEADGRH